MSASEGRRRPLSISPLSLVLGAGASAAVATAALTGHQLTSAEVVAGFTVAGAVAVINVRDRGYEMQPHVLQPLPHDRGDGPVVLAPRARSIAAHPSASSDAA